MSPGRLRVRSIGSSGHFRRTHGHRPSVLAAAPQAVPRAPAYLGIALVYLYRYTVGVLFPGGCKYHPSCSQYAIDALRRYGLFRGVVLAGWRLLRCNPWSRGGVDYVEQQRLFR
jgi:putative membrane protein insertion efficiency factor